MTPGWFATQLNDSWDALRHLKLGSRRVMEPRYPLDWMSRVRDKSYIEEWRLCYDNEWYDFLLPDGSLFQFVPPTEEGFLSFSYYDCPLSIMDYPSFVREFAGDDYRVVGDEYVLDYEQYLDTAEPRPHVTPARYDYSPRQYRSGVHPASHLHLGNATQIRIATERIMRPCSFVFFILRQHYPLPWVQLREWARFEQLVGCVRESLDLVDKKYFQERDFQELFLR